MIGPARILGALAQRLMRGQASAFSSTTGTFEALPYDRAEYYKKKRSILRFNHNCQTSEEATQYFRNRLINLAATGRDVRLQWRGEVTELVDERGRNWGCSTAVRDEKRTLLHSVYLYPEGRRQGHMSRWLRENPGKEIFTVEDCGIEAYLAREGAQFRVFPEPRHRYAPEYGLAAAFYGDTVTDRARIHFMNHIDEGLFVLENIGGSDLAKRAYILHPLVQGDEDLERFWHSACPSMLSDPTVLALALEYRNIANNHLSYHPPPSEAPFYKSPLKDVNDMLIADKVQNRKDFELYHEGAHPRWVRLASYFREWLEKLDVSEKQYQELSQAPGIFPGETLS